MNETVRSVTVCQKFVRGFTARRLYVSMKQTARKYEEDMKLLNDIVRQTTDCMKALQKQLYDEDVKHQEEKLRAAEEEKRKSEAKLKAEKQKENNRV